MNRHQRKLAFKLRPCANCKRDAGSALFCGTCYGLMDGGTKVRIRQQIGLGSPRLAIRTGIEYLNALRASGVEVPQRERRAA